MLIVHKLIKQINYNKKFNKLMIYRIKLQNYKKKKKHKIKN